MGNLIIKQKLTKLIQAGVSFEVAPGKLLIKGDLSVLKDEDRGFLKDNKEAIISLIENQTQEIPIIQKINESIPKPLSFSQQSLWLLDKINEGSNHYNLTSAFRLKGRINYKALDQTFLTILQRHESLRSCFLVDASGEPVQKIQDVSHFNVVVEELDTALNDYESQIAQIIQEETHKIFDLTKDLLLSVRLLKLSPEEHILIANMHHIASDGWSKGILVKEISVLYSSYVKEEPNPLPELSIQYSDYAYWQRQWLKGKVLEEQTNYWKNQLAELPLLHNLPLDKPRPITQSFKGSIHTSHVHKDLLRSLYDLCQAEAASLFMGIHAAFSSLLARYSNETDIVVGCPIANRERVETAPLVGFFMNLLVLRSDLSKNPGFRELLRQSKKMLEEAYQYQQMPFEKLTEELKVKRNLSHNPLFQILLTLHNNEQGKFSLPDVVMEPVNYNHVNRAKYDLSLNITESAEGLLLSWEYNTDLFEAATIARMADHFNSLLEALLANPEENVFKVNMISENEAAEIYKHLKGDVLAVNNSDSAIKSFDHQVKHIPGETAIICNDISCNYKQLGEKVDSIAGLLSDQGVQSGDRVGICLLRDVELIAAIFACFKIGAGYIPLDPVYSSGRINQIIEDAEPKCIITLKPLKERYLNAQPEGNFVYLDKLEIQEEGKIIVSDYGDNNVAYIIFTSGTTGKPKGIEVTHGNLNNLLKSLDVSFGSQMQQRWLAQTSVNFDISVLELIWTISRGQTIVLQQTNPFKLLAPDQLSAARELDFSIMFFGADKEDNGQKYDLLIETAKFADKNKFTAIWTPERHFGEFGGAFASPSVLGAALSAITENINIRAGSVVLPLRDPIRVAEEWSIVDNLSGGRISVSIASGWHPNDFVFSNSNYHNRRNEMREKVAELKDLWKGNPIVRKNGVNKDVTIKIRPTPIQQELPLWITAAGNPETFKYAGEIGANVLTHMLGQSMEKLAENIEIYHQALRDNGFTIADKKVSLMLHTYIDRSESMALSLSEQPFKEYLGSSIQLIEPLAQELGLDVNTQREELIEIAYKKFTRENTLIGSPESSQKMFHSIQSIGVTEVVCLVDFGVESEKVLAGLENIVKAKDLYHSHADLIKLLHTDNQKTELDLIHDYRVTHVQMTPSQSRLMTDLYNQNQDRELSSVQHWLIGGEALSQELIKGLAAITTAKLYNMYGPTETTVWSAWREINHEDIHIGEPVINTDLLLLNGFEQQVPIGVVGELYIGGSGVAKGYYNNPELTDKYFKEINTPGFANRRFYKTGDLMKLNASGTLEYVGRKDNQVKVNGYRIEPEEIEKAISKVPGVKNCKVVPVKKDTTTSLSAYVIKEDIVYGDYQDLPPEEQAKPFHFADGSVIYHQSDRQLGMLYQGIIEGGIYFKHGISVPENGLVLDIGANIGTFSIDVSRRQPSATIIAFEPVPQIFSALKKNFEHRQIKGFIINYGVSNKKEHATFYYYPEMAGMSGRFADGETIVDAVGKYMEYDKESLKDTSRLYEGNREIVKSLYENIEGSEDLSGEFKKYLSSLYLSQEVECQLTTISDIIDELNIQTIDLLKIDVEKSECLALEGIRPEHWPMIRQLAVEVDGDNNLSIIRELLHEKGYDINVDELIMSDANTPQEENTYILYATNPHHRALPNDIVIEQLQAQVSERSIRDFLKEALPDYMNPEDIIFVPSIPLMENGKVDMIKLKEFKPHKTVSNDVVKLTNKTEFDIYRIWCEVLKKESIPHHVSIFEAGGNSIAIVLLHTKLQAAFNVNFSLIELFRNPTISQQAKLIQNANGPESNTVKKAMDKGASRRNARGHRIN